MRDEDRNVDATIAALTAEYEQLIYRDGILIQTLFTTVGIAATVLGALVFAVPEYKKGADGVAGIALAYLAVPLPSAILLGLVIFLSLQIIFIAQYAHAVESHLAALTKDYISESELGVPGVMVQSPAYLRLASRLFGAGRTKRTMIYSANIVVILFLVAALLLITPFIPLRTAPLRINIANIAIYLPLTLIMATAWFRTWYPHRRLLSDVLSDYTERDLSFASRSLVEAPVVPQMSATSKQRSFLGYLVAPRIADHVAKIAVGLMGVLLGGVALSHAMNLKYLRIELLWQSIWFVVVFEFLFYQARYSWNDVRDVEEDQGHQRAADRGRIPAPITRARILTVLCSIPVKVGLGIGLSLFVLKPTIGHPMIVGLVAIVAAAVPYELLRDKTRSGALDPRSAEWWRTAFGVFMLVGPGYGIRMVVGLYLGSGGHIHLGVALLAGATMWAVESSTVAMAWVLEGSAFLVGVLGTPEFTSYDDSLNRKSHLGFLLRQAGLIADTSEPLSRMGAATYSAVAEGSGTPATIAVAQGPVALGEGSSRHILTQGYAGKRLTVWAVGGHVAIVLSTVMGLAVANGFLWPPFALILRVLAVGLVSGLHCYWPSARLAMLLPALAVFLTANSESMPYPLLGAVVPLGVAGFYELTRGGNYDFVVGWLKPIEKLPHLAASHLRHTFGRAAAWTLGSSLTRILTPPPPPVRSAVEEGVVLPSDGP